MQIKEKIIEAPFESYFGVFLTLACSLACEYCVQKVSLPIQPLGRYPIASGKMWVEALRGEPTLHPDFVYIMRIPIKVQF